MSVCIKSSEVHGNGLFATRDIKEGEIIFQENIMLVSTVFRLDGKTWVGCSRAWALTIYFLKFGEPLWLQNLKGNYKLLEYEMNCEKDQKIYRYLKQRFDAVKVESVFAKVLANFYEMNEMTWISPVASMINHSVNSNVGHTEPENDNVMFLATKDIKQDEELFVTYPETYINLL